MIESNCLRVHAGRLQIGGMDVAALARTYGTPLYIMDENEVRAACRAFNRAMRRAYEGEFLIAYASKALSCKEIYRIMNEEGMGADLVSGGELYTAALAGFPMERAFLHGNNKTYAELKMALEHHVHRIVVDNAEELRLLSAAAEETGRRAAVSFRLKPGIEAHTHEFIQTGNIDSKFGLAMETDEAYQTILAAARMPMLDVVGINCHIGSQIFESEPFARAVDILLDFMVRLRDDAGVCLTELNLGGGYGIQYIPSHDPRPVDEVAFAIAEAVQRGSQARSLPLPRLVLEPGRSIVGPAGITVYTAGSVKDIPGVRTYVAVDGGMPDNPRFALYNAVYEAVLPERAGEAAEGLFTIAGRCCESGDIVARDVPLPRVRSGDLVAVLATGAYNYSMASHYNRLPKPPIVMVRDGAARVVVRRETYEDVVRQDV